MRVLLTGMTLNHIGRHKGHRFWDCDLIEVALLAAGHDVERRATTVGEDLSRFDFAFVAMQKMNSITTFEHRFGAIWAAATLPHVLVFEDFAKNFKAPINSLKARYIWDYPTGGMLTEKLEQLREAARPRRAAIDRTIEFWASPAAKAMIIGYQWGRRVIKAPQQLRKVDITAFYPLTYENTGALIDDATRERRWAFATLLRPEAWRYDPREHARWPILNIGHPAADNTPERKQVSYEALVRQWYCTSWGVMAWPYRIEVAGAGIWRDRFHHAIAAGCVALFSGAEVHELGGPWIEPIHAIERMSDSELRALVDRQRSAFQQAQLSQEYAVDALNDLIATHHNPPGIAT